MRVAQRLYEGVDIGGETVGLITYMRTDGVQIAEEAIPAVRRVIEQDYGKDYLPPAPRKYETKAKNAQEAHEAIRPTELSRRPRDTKSFLDADQAKLYELIWLRTVASQMESAELERTTVDISAKVASRVLDLRATGTVVKFDGFLTLYQEGKDEDPDDEDARRLPEMSAGEKLAKRAIAADQHFTEPPPRYSEASLVKRMEELGIGRPSTYASILQVLATANMSGSTSAGFIPRTAAASSSPSWKAYFARYVEYDFTAGLEDQLDLISNNEIAWRDVLRDFWRDFIGAIDETKELRISAVIDTLDAMLSHASVSGARGRQRSARLPDLQQWPAVAKTVEIRRLHRLLELSGMPIHPAALGVSADGAPDIGTKKLGVDPETGLDVTVRSGRFGPYLQLGEGAEGEKPKRASLPKDVAPDAIDFARALQLLSLPRVVGKHPEDGEPIKAGIGRFGPYVQHNKTYANLETPEDVFTIGLNHAVTLIAEKIAKGPRKGRFGADPGRAVGDHPTKGGAIVAKKGRYGPYVSHDGVNATLPADKTPETVTLDEAVALIDARAERNGPAPHARPRKAKRPSPGTARHIKPSSKRPAATTAKRPRRRQTAAQEKAGCRIIVVRTGAGLRPPARKSAYM